MRIAVLRSKAGWLRDFRIFIAGHGEVPPVCFTIVSDLANISIEQFAISMPMNMIYASRICGSLCEWVNRAFHFLSDLGCDAVTHTDTDGHTTSRRVAKLRQMSANRKWMKNL